MNVQPLRPPLVVAFGSHVFGVNPETGSHIWERTLEAESVHHARIYVLPRYVLVLKRCLWCLDLATGATVWKTEGETPGDTLLCDGQVAFVGGNGEVWGVRVADGAMLWHDGFKGMGMASVALGLPWMAAQVDVSR